MARTSAIGLRREPQPPMPMVMPSRICATTSAIVIDLSTPLLPVLGLGGVAAAACPPTNASLARPPTPDRLSSNVKPCSKR